MLLPILARVGHLLPRLRSLPARAASARACRRSPTSPRPRRMGALVLVAVMTFFFREYDYSRVVIVYFWLFSIASVSLSRATSSARASASRAGAATTCATRWWWAAASWPPTWSQRLRARPDVGIQVLGLVGDEQRARRRCPWLGGYADLRAVLDAHPVDHVILALAHEDYGRLAGLLDAIGDEPVTIHVVPDLFRFASLRGRRRGVRGHAVRPPAGVAALRVEPVAKRVFDFVFSPPSSCGSAPLCSCSPLAVRLTLARPGALPPGAHGARRPALPHAEVPDHAVGRRARTSGPVWARGRRRAAHADRRLPAALQPRRAAAVRQRAARRDERGGAAAGAPGVRRALPPDRARLHAPPQGQGRASPAGPRSTGCAATPRSRSASSTTSSTSSAGRSGSTSRSSR